MAYILALSASFHSHEVQMAWPTSFDTCWGVHYTVLMEGGHRVTKQTVKVLWHHIRHVIGARWLSFCSAEQLAIFSSHFTLLDLTSFLFRKCNQGQYFCSKGKCKHCVKDFFLSLKWFKIHFLKVQNTENQVHISGHCVIKGSDLES